MSTLIIPEKLQKEGRGNYWIQIIENGQDWEMAEIVVDRDRWCAYIPGRQMPLSNSRIAEIGEEIVMSNPIEKLTDQLLKLTPDNQKGYIFPEYYPHTDKIMWKIMNPYTQYNQEKVVLHPVDEGMEKSLIAAIQYLENAKKFHDPK